MACAFYHRRCCTIKLFVEFFVLMILFIKNITIKFFAYLMIGILAMIIANNAMFTHAHKDADGIIFVHAHPYDKSTDKGPFKSHQHSKTELLIFENFNNLIPGILLIYLLFMAYKIIIYQKYRISRYSTDLIKSTRDRAPPISCLIFY